MPEYKGVLSSKLPTVGLSIFSKMSALANENNAINLSQGFPDFQVSPTLIELVANSMKAGHNQYAPMAGLLSLREKISEHLFNSYSANYHPEHEITITAGATQAVYTAIAAIIREGDEVIIFTPAYDCYAPAVELNGGKAVFIQLKSTDYTIDWSKVKKVINRHTKMIIINTPHNPTGAILSAQDMIQLDKITKDNDIVILSDEVYEQILFDGYEHQSVARYPNLAEKSFIIFSFGKSFHATGWKMGYCVAPKALMNEFRKVHQYLVFAVNTPIQYALKEYISQGDAYNGIREMYQQKRDMFNSLIKSSRFKLKPSAGTYFQLLDYTDISNENDVDFAIRLTKEFKVASIPVSVFYHNPVYDNVLRFCFAKQDETLEKAAEILCKI
jgi:methionine aminotransferase